MNNHRYEAISKFLCKILRHSPEEFGIKLNSNHQCLLEDLFMAVEDHSDFRRQEVSYVLITSMWKDIHRFNIFKGYVKATFKHTYYMKEVFVC